MGVKVMKGRFVTWAACFLGALAAAATAAQADAPLATQPATRRAAATTSATDVRFLRFTGDARKGGILETADVAYRNAAGVEVRLVAAVHIGEQTYFERLQRSF